MELTYDEVEAYLDQICSGTKIVSISDVSLIFKYPDLKTRIRARYIYDNELSSAVVEGLITNDEMKKLLTDKLIITEDEEVRLRKLKSELEAQRVLLGKTNKVKARQDSIKEAIIVRVAEINEIEFKETSKYSMTAETRADESKALFLCWNSCFSLITDLLYWNDYNDFLKEPDYVFRLKIVNGFMRFYNGLSIQIVRTIARSDLWRVKYVTSTRVSEPLFGIPASEYNNNMTNLLYWSHYYQNIYEMMPDDKPDDLIIEDDEALDAYMKDFYAEKSRESSLNKSRSRHGNLSAYDKDEVIVTRADPLYELVEYDTPKEAQLIKDKALVSKRTRRG